MSLLEVKALNTHYDKSHVLMGIDLKVEESEIVSVLGRNGSGRSTMLKSLIGLVPPSSGSVCLDGEEIAGFEPHRIVKKGLGYVPEERLIFANVTVHENLIIGEQPARPAVQHWTIDQMYEFFPTLKARCNTLAGNLSGGEQQLLTLCRSLLVQPRLLLVDEPTEGLAPRIVAGLIEFIREINRGGVAIMLVEQKMTVALKVSHRCLIMGRGRIVFDGTPTELREDTAIRRKWLEVS